jgi:uncharacterized SAM-binding protein YcdF (DUF218 family)
MQHNMFILGSPNSVDGVLSSISVKRIEKAIALQKANPDIVLMATGGFGSHFNTSTIPHRELLHQYLLQQDAVINPGSPDDLLSSNTVQDAIMILQFSNSRGLEKIGVVTSKFHMARCRYIFECLTETDFIEYFAADDPSSLSSEINRHESTALARLQAQGGVIIDDVLYPHMRST